MTDALAFCRNRSGWLVDTVAALARVESPSTDPRALGRCAAALEAPLAATGARVTRVAGADGAFHLRAEVGRGEPQVLLLGHFDTVWDVGQIERMPVEIRDGRLVGPGVLDMKSGLAIAMLGAEAAAAAQPRGRIVLLFTCDEEVGSATSRAIIEEEARRSRAVLVFEPALPGGGVKTSRKGVGDLELVVEGVSAHAGADPGRGASAIHELARQIAALEGLRDDARGISVNVGTIAGGTRTNVVAEQARAGIDVRVRTLADALTVETALRAVRPFDPRTRVRVLGSIARPPMERTAGVARLFAIARDEAAAMGVDLAEGATGGASDGNFTGALGIPTLDGLGGVGDGAHAIDEQVEVASLPLRAALAARLVLRVLEGPELDALRRAPRG